ncbi:hypothetical protein CIHG_07821 [Coccidioides immitis H538.4]|uniref:Uncharacterized protein n=1 Tax=Coccidioides immitis H538.4 TaxID=396776 RepID=A0A0J8UQG3_COCIT|nr:hypothetical protein CIHG_07821 [Coccidioides immitis H538.4]
MWAEWEGRRVDKTIVSLEKAAGEMRDGMDVLRDDVREVKAAKEVDELRKECVKSKRTPGSLPSQRYSTLSEPPAAQPSPKAPKRARKSTRALSRISETPSSFRFRRMERPPSVELIPESLPLPPAESPAPMVDFDFTQMSPISAPPSEDFLMGQQKQPSRGTQPEDPIRSLKQNALSLSNYLELGRSVLAKFPRRRDEKHRGSGTGEGWVELECTSECGEGFDRAKEEAAVAGAAECCKPQEEHH